MLQNRPQKKGKPGREEFEATLSLDQADDRFRDLFDRHGLKDLPHDKRRTLVRFYKVLLADQSRHNSTRLHTIREVGIKHFVDCLLVPQLTKLQFPLIDVGTGPGFPGIPLKIMYPEKRILLCEGVQHRVEFLKRVRDELNLPNLDIIGRKIAPGFGLPVNGVITRAFNGGSMCDLLETMRVALQKDGCAYFMKGPGVDPELKEAVHRFKGVYELADDIAYDIPHTPHQRRLVIFKKLIADLPSDEYLDAEWDADPYDD